MLFVRIEIIAQFEVVAVTIVGTCGAGVKLVVGLGAQQV